ncbi:Glycosyl phosphatidyl inositol anchor synthesis [Plenodomus lingam]|uniref:GPI ethanolamine phosphate transferase 1 n=1 Tax=Leptosphaeria maculans (strain JN3 / isolate v23.1.3 / race Av1-4-5-6-7-8) TaxID=985895 RepID=E4ZIE4_LEPMJ|nr:similar to GPI ethanolamine phosphate transferase [Plenodomus lingam JN3]KAH9877073.1 Glycosyl phosphatidyl inositol anchor synthesis [Plenodomus lingam]CBX90965.1 similar to GPI ethanolamine phosphate transferase [Plenodomus lingam JN3]
MAQFGRYHFLIVAVVFHLAYIYSIFSIYFVSPIVHGMREHRVETQEAPAKRLVLFVGDGLRADKAFQYFPNPNPDPTDSSSVDPSEPRPLAPFLRSRVLESGTFGVSHTRVPTESRPGHVALIAGLYEDVSAVMTGWKLNPVNFDSVFNRSRHTWSWGSPDILPMFEQGAVPGRVDADCYGHEFEDFSKDAWVLDEWVFDRVKKLFADAKTNATLDAELRQEKNVFFLHLLGLDTTGHAHRPYSWQYLHNIQIVDRGVQEITELIEEFYSDDKTAFVFTADHGMSDWGSHGDGHQDNTRTPLIAWGAGVAKPVKTKTGLAPGHEDHFSSDWHLDHIQRHDVEQADVAALMAYLVGLDFPTNSVGVLPLGYLDTDEKSKAEAFLTNAKEILEMYHVKEEQKKATEIRYKPFPGLGDETHSVEHRVSKIQKAIDAGVNKADFKKAIEETYELIDLGLEGIRYLQTYDWLFLRTIITAGYVGWIVFALTTVINLHVLSGEVPAQRTAPSTVFFCSVAVALYGVLIKQRSPIIYWVYVFFPVIFWEEIFARRQSLVQGGRILFGHVQSKGEVVKLVLGALGFLGLLQALVQSYFIREIYTICYLLATLWPAVYGTEFMRKHKGTVATWVSSCMAMSVFTMLPANKAEDVRLILLGGFLMFAVGMLYLVFEDRILEGEPIDRKVHEISRLLIGVQLGLILLSMIVTKSSIGYIRGRQGLPLGVLTVGWTTLIASLFMPQLHGLFPNHHYIHRLVVIFLQFSPTFVILSISYEGLFYFAFCCCLFAWMRLEHQVQQHTSSHPTPAMTAKQSTKTDMANGGAAKEACRKYRPLALADTRIALFFLYFLQSAFFSASNISSVSSFSLDAVYRLIPIFDPFSQGGLLVLKLMLPFACLSAVFGLLNRRLGVAPSALFMLVMAVTDVLTLGFFYMVRDEGSWLEIGTGISHFVIASLLGVFVVGLEGVSEWVVSGVRFRESEDGKKVQ